MDAVQIEKAVKALGDKPTLNNFIEQFGVFTKTPSSIIKIKKLILSLGVSGKLTKYNESDTFIDNYLQSINDKRLNLIKLRAAKSYKKIGLSLRENIPSHWRSVELGEVFVPISVGKKKVKTKDVLESGEFPVIDQGKSFVAGYTNEPDKVIKTSSPVIIFGDHTKALKIVDFDFVAGADGVKILSPILINPYYFLTVLQSYNLDDRDYGRHYKILLSNDFPLPPPEEQKRIVAKVDELMALCDQLQIQQQQQANTLLKANTAAIHALLSAESGQAIEQKADRQNPKNKKQQASTTDSDNTTAENTSLQGDNLLEQSRSSRREETFKKAWQRIEKNFHTLYGNTLPMPPGQGRQKKYFVGLENIKNLRQTILHLAVIGKLTNPVSSEGTGRELLLTINEIREQLISEKKIKKLKIDRDLSSHLFNNDLPVHWEWVLLGDLITKMDAGWSPACDSQPADVGTWGVLKTTAVQTFEYWGHENKSLPSKLKPKPEYEVHKGDILFTRAGPKQRVGICCLVEETQEKLMTSDKIIRVHLVDGLLFEKYIALTLNAGISREFLDSQKSGMAESQMNISQPKLRATPIPLPPLEEQKCIVAKVDQLMAHCDQLEQQLTTAYSDAEKLITATIKQLVA